MRDQEKESLIKTYNDKPIDKYKHVSEISCYNHNYYIGENRYGVKADLIFAKSDDDNMTDYYLVGQYGYELFGYSYTSQGDIINVDFTVF